jgi:Na+/H+-dicarboxylate symporter
MTTTSDTTKDNVRLPNRFGLGQQVLIALTTEIVFGGFLGEYAESIGVIGDIYIGLLQIMVTSL